MSNNNNASGAINSQNISSIVNITNNTIINNIYNNGRDNCAVGATNTSKEDLSADTSANDALGSVGETLLLSGNVYAMIAGVILVALEEIMDKIAQVNSALVTHWVANTRVETAKQLTLEEKQHNVYMASQQVALSAIQAAGEITKRNVALGGKVLNESISVTFKTLDGGIRESAHTAAINSYSTVAQGMFNIYDAQYSRLQVSNLAIIKEQETALANKKLTNRFSETELAGEVDKANAWSFLPIADIYATYKQGQLDELKLINEADEKRAEWQLEQQKMVVKVKEKQLQAINDAKKEALQQATEAVKQVQNFASKIEQYVKNSEKFAKLVGNELGLGTNSMKGYTRQFLIDAAQMFFKDKSGRRIYLNQDPENMAKDQSAYIEASGRNFALSGNDFKLTSIIGEIFGDRALTNSLLGSLDYFNYSIETGTDLLYDMYQTANKAGISNRKFAKEFQQNMKLAQKYQFQGGVENMMKIALWAQKTRFNMAALESALSSMHEGGLEGAITKSANLQVLGGNAALLSNPLAMFYDSYADAGGFAKKLAKMGESFGHWDSKLGDVRYSINDQLQLEAIARANNIDPQTYLDQNRQRIKNSEIDKRLTANYSEEQKQLLYSKAQYNKNTGAWEVSVNGQRKNINSVGEADWVHLMPTEEAILDHVAAIRNMLDQEAMASKTFQSELGLNVYDTVTAESMKSVINTEALFNDLSFFNTMSGMLITTMKFASESQKLNFETMLASEPILKQTFNIFKLGHEKFINGAINANSDLRQNLELAISDIKKSTNAFATGVGGSFSNMDISTDEASENLENFGADYSQQAAEFSQKMTKKYPILDLTNKNKNNNNNTMSLKYDTKNGSPVLVTPYIEKIVYKNQELKSLTTSNATTDYYNKYNIKNNITNFVPTNTSTKETVPTKQINDGTLKIAKSHPHDTALFAKSSGPIDTTFKNANSKMNVVHNYINNLKNSNTNTNSQSIINGEFYLNVGGKRVNILEKIKNDQYFISQLTQKFITQIGKNANGGKITLFRNRYAST